MSYRCLNTGDPELDRKWIDEDYEMLFPNLLAEAADLKQRFVVWLDKLVLIDRDRTVVHLREQWGTLNHIQRVCAKLRPGREIENLLLE